MIPLLTRTLLTRGARWIILPLSIVIGLAGSQAQGYFQKDKNERDNRDFPAAWERREQRQMDEFESSAKPSQA